MAPRRLAVWVALALVAGAVTWALTGLPGAPAACLPADCDCEAPVRGPIRQPANAWSSLALAAAGIFLWSVSPATAGETRGPQARAEGSGPSSTRPGKPWPKAAKGANSRKARPGGVRPTPQGRPCTRDIAAGALIAAGLGAFLYHAGLNAWAARLDGITVTVLVGALALHTLGRLHRPARWRSLTPWLLLLLGGLCWWLGQSGGPWCRPGSLLQAHAAWHLLAALAAGLWLGAA